MADIANKTAFKNIQLVTSANTTWSNDVLYLVRTNAEKTYGYIQMNGKKYGNIDQLKTDLLNGATTYTDFKAIENYINSLNASQFAYTNTGLTGVTDVKGALDTLVSKDAESVKDVQVNGTSILNTDNEANLIVDGTYAATGENTNKIATESTVKNAIDALDVTETEVGTGNVKVKYSETDGKVTIAISQDNSINATDLSTAINALDYNLTDNANLVTVDGNVIKIATTIKEEDGVIAVSGTQALAAVAKTGAASDVSFKAGDGSELESEDVNAAILELEDKLDGKNVDAEGDKYVSASATDNKVTVAATTGTSYVINNAFVGASYENNVITLTRASVDSTDVASAVTLNLLNEMFLDQTKTTFVNNFAWSEETYPGSTNPNLNGKPVMVLAVKGTYPETTTYSFLDMDALVDDAYTIALAEDTTDTIVLKNGETTVGTVKISKVDEAAKVTNKLSATIGGATVEYDGSAAKTLDVDGAIDGKLGNLNANVTAGTSYINVGVVQVNGEVTSVSISDTIQAMTGATGDNKGLAEASDVKAYVDAKVGTAVQSVDASATEKDKSVTQSDYAVVKLTATTDSGNNVTLDTAVGLTIQDVEDADETHQGLAEASDVKDYVDGKVTGLNKASTEAANKVLVGVSETNGIVDSTATELQVNGVSFTHAVGATAMTATIKGSDIAAGTLTNAPTAITADSKINTVLDDIYATLGAQELVSSDKTITVGTSAGKTDVVVNRETASAATVGDGHIEIAANSTSGAMYGVMYYGGDDVA